MSSTWGTVTTLKEDPRSVQRFVAHHKAIGASEIHLYFDDPDDPCADMVRHVEGVHVVRCDDAHWGMGAPDKLERRQKKNARDAYARSRVDWLIHVDADELLYCPGGLAQAIDRAAPDPEVLALRVAPAEAMSWPKENGVDIFRRPLPRGARGRRLGEAVYGALYPLTSEGLLSHTVGKFLVRTGQDGVAMSIHAPFLNDDRIQAPLLAEATLLHLHGHDEEEWLAALKRRMDTGAYRSELQDNPRRAGDLEGMGRTAYLQMLADTEGEDGLRRFYRQICAFDNNKRKLRRAGALLRARLWIDEKIATHFPGTAPVHTRNVALNPETGLLEAEIDFRGQRMIVSLEDNYTEAMLAAGHDAEQEEADAIVELIAGRKILFWDIGANAGVYSMLAAGHAAPDSSVLAFEPNPRMADRFERNMALNGNANVTLHRVALGEKTGKAKLFLHENLGQASMIGEGRENGEVFEVPVRTLWSFVKKADPSVYSVLKIDIEGAEPMCLAPFFRSAARASWPDAILYEHSHADQWNVPPEQLFPADAYRPLKTFRDNTLLVRAEA